MGYLVEKYSTIFKGAWITYWKERRLTTRITGNMHRIHEKIFTKLPNKVNQHKVTRALNEIKSLEKDLEKTGKQEFKFLFDESYQEEAALKPVIKIEKMLEKLKASAVNKKEVEEIVKKIDRIFATYIIKAMKKLRSQDRSEYNDVLNIIKAAKEVDKETFMNKLKTTFKDIDVSKFRKWPIRKNVSAFRKRISKIKRDDKEIEKLTTEIEKMLRGKKVREDMNKTTDKLTLLAENLEKDLVIGFYEAYKGMKRIFALIYILEGYQDVLNAQMEDWKAKKLLPSSPVDNAIKKIKDGREKFIKDMHVIAQALRRIYQEIGGLEKGAARLAT